MYRYPTGSATETSRLLVPVPEPEIHGISSAPARLVKTPGSYDSMSPPETPSVVAEEEDPLIDFSPDREQPKA